MTYVAMVESALAYYTVLDRMRALKRLPLAYTPEPDLVRPRLLACTLELGLMKPLPSEHTPLGKAQPVMLPHSWHKIVDQEQQPSDKCNKPVVMVVTKLYSSKLGIGHRY